MKEAREVKGRSVAARVLAMALGGLALLLGTWVGLGRAGAGIPFPRGTSGAHGPLMALGFLGTLISLERAVALRRSWAYLAPFASAVGSLSLFLGAPRPLGWGVLVGAGALFLAVLAVLGLVSRGPRLPLVLALLGGFCWPLGAGLAAIGRPVAAAAWWFAGFLVLTVVGERVELARIGAVPWQAAGLLAAGAAVLVGGLALSLVVRDGVRVAGFGLFLLGLFLLLADVGRRTWHLGGLARFSAVAVLAGAAWLVVGGLAWIRWGYQVAGGAYDLELHTVFLGFALSMVFGHAPVVGSALLGRTVPFREQNYLHLLLLHLSLVLRFLGDLLAARYLVAVGTLGNALAILIFLGSLHGALLASGKARS